MNSFKFSLSKLRDYKDQQIKKEKHTLMRMHVKLNMLAEKLQTCMSGIDSISIEISEKMKMGVSVMEMQLLEIKKSSLRNEQTELGVRINTLKKMIENQQRIVMDISCEISELEKLEEKQKSQYLYRVDKENQDYIDEFISHHISRGREPGVSDFDCSEAEKSDNL